MATSFPGFFPFYLYLFIFLSQSQLLTTYGAHEIHFPLSRPVGEVLGDVTGMTFRHLYSATWWPVFVSPVAVVEPLAQSPWLLLMCRVRCEWGRELQADTFHSVRNTGDFPFLIHDIVIHPPLTSQVS